jgi:class 3 adenylate cyclase
MARLRAQVLDTEVRAIAVRQPGAAPVAGGTAALASLWEKARIPVESIDLDDTGAEPHAAPGPSPPSPTRHEIRALLFADAVGYSKLTEDQVPVYITRFLGAIAALARASPHKHEHVETAGDGIYMVFANAADAGHFALELSALVTGTDWGARGLPADFNLRVALHCGPVHCGRDPLTGLPIYTGPHTSRAARIEPITPPGQVYASSAYAAVVAATAADLVLTYVGRMPLAKGYGTLGLYHVRRER